MRLRLRLAGAGARAATPRGWHRPGLNFTPGTRSTADYTGEADPTFVPSQRIYDSILGRERQGPHGLNGYPLLLHIGAGPGPTDRMHNRLSSLLDDLAARGYRFVRVDELLR